VDPCRDLGEPAVPAHRRVDSCRSAVADGRRFDFKREQIKDLRLSAKRPNGDPVDIRMDFKGNGLAGLAGVGVFKGKEGKE
jgi:hypothetical protein